MHGKEREKKRHFQSYRKCRHDAQITWPYAYYVTLGSRCKVANSSSEDETGTLPERHTRIHPYQFEPVRQDFERVLEHRVSFDWHAVFHGVCEIALTEVLFTQMGVMQHSKKVSSFELYKLNPLSPHCGLIGRELVHCYTWGRLLQFAATQYAGIVNFFVDHTHTQFTEESNMATALTPQTDVTSFLQIFFFFFFLMKTPSFCSLSLFLNFISLNLKLVTHLSIISMVILHT